MTQLEKNKAELWADIEKLADQPVDHSNGSMLVAYMKMYDAYCKVSRHRKGAASDGAEDGETRHFDREMAVAWTSAMVNADGTKGPHWTMEQTSKAMEDYRIACDPVLWWAVMNSIYSDYCEALKKNNVSTLEVYVCMAKAWINDDDAVPDKAAAYYTYIVKR